eukprot:1158913-Pelagomonas_calceolata.AAC.2
MSSSVPLTAAGKRVRPSKQQDRLLRFSSLRELLRAPLHFRGCPRLLSFKGACVPVQSTKVQGILLTPPSEPETAFVCESLTCKASLRQLLFVECSSAVCPAALVRGICCNTDLQHGPAAQKARTWILSLDDVGRAFYCLHSFLFSMVRSKDGTYPPFPPNLSSSLLDGCACTGVLKGPAWSHSIKAHALLC